MALEVMSWNIRDGLSNEAMADTVIAHIETAMPDVLVLAEAYRENKQPTMGEKLHILGDLGYCAIAAPYADDDGRADRHYLVGCARDELVESAEALSLGTRNALYLQVVDPASDKLIDTFLTHLDDRRESRRLAQAQHLLAAIDPEAPAIIAGDMNAMHSDDPRARLLRMARPLAKRLPTIEPRPDYKYPKLKRMGSLASRLTDMATGTTLAAFEAAGFADANTQHLPTRGPVTIDYIMARDLLVNNDSFVVHDQTEVSDHRAISAVVG